MTLHERLPLAFFVALGLSLASGQARANGDPGGDSGAGETGASSDLSTAWFAAPLPNAFFETAPATLDAEIQVHQGVDGEPIAEVELFVDDASIGAMPCDTGCVFPDIELAKGAHELRLAADIGVSRTTVVYVEEEPPSVMNPCDTTDTGDADGEGANCSVQGPGSPWELAALALLLLPLVRRKSRSSP